MMTDPRIADADARRQALLPEHSFIVQAPAGSGKTELLIQRYLMLLARVESPEEIVAITFTRKAAAEMRYRITEALVNAKRHQPPAAQPDQTTWELARAARRHDTCQGWGLEYHPARLRIQTIDSLCASLTRQMPLLSRFGAQPGITEEAEALYRQAARATLAEVESGAEWSASVEALLRHLDNDWEKIESLLAAMLARRDQWLRHNHKRLQREALEKALQASIRSALQRVDAGCPPPAIMRSWLALARFAADNAVATDSDSPLSACISLQTRPGTGFEHLPQWLGLAHLVLTKEGGWRKQALQSIGFPPLSAARTPEEKQRLREKKEAFEELVACLRGEERFRCALQALRSLPPPRYTEAQWAIMEALFQLLPLAVAHLRLVFQERGEVDFTEVAQQAVAALGHPEAPTDLALALDYQIRHLLMDEFQDTSLSQYLLLERLTAGWEPGDGRSLFLVGDPMQSIYRFREAEVGLYLRAWREGIGAIPLTPLTLSVNFRSQQGIVDWANQAFRRIFPQTEDRVTGAVPYCHAHGFHPPLAEKAVQIHPFFKKPLEEAKTVVRLVQETKQAAPEATVAILVRSRTHLGEIVPLLREARLRFRAIDIEPLGCRPVVQDLVALTRALFHPADRLSWLTVLRAPWCGLTLRDLYALAGEDLQAVIWDRLNDEACLQRLSEEGRQRLSRVCPVLAKALAGRRRTPLRRFVEGVWLALGGPACLADSAALEEAYVYLDLLERQTPANELVDFSALDEAVAKLFAPPDNEADERLQIMTIHRAKGLEFDTVIVPGLGRSPRHESSQLLLWAERPAFDRGVGKESQLLLAPIAEAGGNAEGIYQYIKGLHEEKSLLENGRLLYVAVTRARHRLHLLGQVGLDAGGRLKSPPKHSLLASLWPVAGAEFEAAAAASGVEASAGEEKESAAGPTGSGLFSRLVADWRCPEPVPGVKVKVVNVDAPEAAAVQDPVEFAWAGETARYIGMVAHRYLQIIARQGLEGWNEARVISLGPSLSRALREQGVVAPELAGAVKRTQEILIRTLRDERGQWILSPRHRQARNEYPLSGLLDGQVVRVVIDRTFIDEKGRRWIVDYKTGVHEGGGREAFLDREQERYRIQLESYAALMAARESTMVKIYLGLYYPQFCGWREWYWPNE